VSIWGPKGSPIGMPTYNSGPMSGAWQPIGTEGVRSQALMDEHLASRAASSAAEADSYQDSITSLDKLINPEKYAEVDPFEEYLKTLEEEDAKEIAAEQALIDEKEGLALDRHAAVVQAMTDDHAYRGIDTTRRESSFSPTMDPGADINTSLGLEEDDLLGQGYEVLLDIFKYAKLPFLSTLLEPTMLDAADFPIDEKTGMPIYPEMWDGVPGSPNSYTGFADGGRVGLQAGGIPWTQYMSPSYANQYYSQFSTPNYGTGTFSSMEDPGDTTGTTPVDPGPIAGNTPQDIIYNTPIQAQGGGGDNNPNSPGNQMTTDSFGHNVSANQVAYGVDPTTGNLVASHVPSNVTSISLGDPAPAAVQFGYDVVTGLPTIGNIAMNLLGLNQQTDPTTLGTLDPSQQDQTATGVNTNQENQFSGLSTDPVAMASMMSNSPGHPSNQTNIGAPGISTASNSPGHPSNIGAMVATGLGSPGHPSNRSNVGVPGSGPASSPSNSPGHPSNQTNVGAPGISNASNSPGHPGNQTGNPGNAPPGLGAPGNFGSANAAAQAAGFAGAVGYGSNAAGTGPAGAVTGGGGVVGFGRAPSSSPSNSPGHPGNRGSGSGDGDGCFIAGTPITMADGTTKPVEEVDLGDEVAVGGKVFATGKFLIDDLHEYKGIQVSGSHMVKEDDKWTRVEDSKLGKSLGDDEHTVYVFGAENRRILIDDVLFTDYFETAQQDKLMEVPHENLYFDNWKDIATQENAKSVSVMNAF